MQTEVFCIAGPLLLKIGPSDIKKVIKKFLV
jgi:hypothetical protein